MTVHKEYERAKMLADELVKRRRRLGNKFGAPIPAQEEAKWLYGMEKIADKLVENLHAMANGESPATPAPEADPVPAPKDVVVKKDTPEVATVPPTKGNPPWSP